MDHASWRTLDFDDINRLDPHLLKDIGVCRCDLLHRALAWHWGYACDQATTTPRPSGDDDRGAATSGNTRAPASARRIEIVRVNAVRPV
jgi:hypothetical protein